MVHQKSEVHFSTSNIGVEDNVAAETTLIETELSNHPVQTMMEEVEGEKIVVGNDEVNEYERIMPEEEGKGEEHASEEEEDANEYEEDGADEEGNQVESEKVVVSNDEVNEYERIVAEEEGEGEEHASEQEEDVNDYEENGADEVGNQDNLAAEEDDSDDGDYDDEDDLDDYEDDNDGDDDHVDVDEDDDLMEDEGDVDHKESDVYGDEDNKESTLEGESDKEENEEKGGGSLKPQVHKVGEKNGRKEVGKRDLSKVTSKSENKSKRGEAKDPMVEEDEENAKEEIEEKGEGSAQKKVNKLIKRNTRKVTRGSSEKVVSKQEDKLESFRRKKTSKKVKSMGMIFMCNSKTKRDCYRYKVLGLPASKRDIVGKIYKGMRLFLYDVDLKLMYGIYKAAGHGGYNIERKAFKSQFPSQVRFTVLKDCKPLAEEKFKKVIKENYFTRSKFDCQLKSEQVKKLCKLFVAANKVSRSKRLDRGPKEKTHSSIKRDRPRARAIEEDRRSALDEKHQYLDYPHIHRREVIASPLSPLSRIAPLRRPGAAPSYAYDRIMEIDAYRQNVLVDHGDPYRLPHLESRDAYRREPYIQPILESLDAYRREPLLEHHNVYRSDHLLNNPDSYRRGVVVEPRDRRPVKLGVRHRDEIAGHDPYILYRERRSYHDPVYIEHLSPERDRYHRGGLRPEYTSREGRIPEFRSTRARYRY